MRCRMIDDIRSIGLEHLEDLPGIPDRSDDHVQLQIWIVLSQLQLNVIGIILIDIEDDQMLRLMGCDLSAQLTADTASATGHQYGLVLQILEDFCHIGNDRITPQQIFDGYFLHLADCHFSIVQLIHTRQAHQFAVRLIADLKNISLICRRSAGNGHIDLLDAELLTGLQNGFPATEHHYAVDVASPLILIVIDKAIHLFSCFFCMLDVAEDHLSGCTGSDQHDALTVRCFRIVSASQQ